MVRLALGIILPALIGLPFTLWLPTWVTRLAVAFLAGMVLITASVLATGALSGRAAVAGLAVLGIVWSVAAVAAILRERKVLSARPAWPKGRGLAAWVLIALAALNVVTAAAYAFKTPIADWDVTHIWLPRAQAFATGGLRGLSLSAYPDYPPLWTIHMTLVNSGTAASKLLPSAYWIATIALAFEHVRRRVGPAWAGACAFAISGVPYLWLPYGVNDLMSEIPTAAFLTASAVMLAEFAEVGSVQYAAAAAAMAIGLVWVRPEGFLFAFVIAAGMVLLSWGRRSQAVPALVAAGSVIAAYVVWRVFVRFVLHAVVGLQPNVSALTPSIVITSLVDTVRYAAANLGNPYLFGPALIAVALMALGFHYWWSFGVIATVLFIDLALGVALYVALPSTSVGEPLIWWLTTGFKRMAMHLVPLLYIATSVALGMWWGKSEKNPVPRVLAGAGLAAALAVLLVAAYGAYRVGGPKSYDLSLMSPSHVDGPSIDYSTPGEMTVATDGTSNPQVVFYLLNTGRRTPPLDNISGTFSRFSAQLAVHGANNVGEEFTVTADGKIIARQLVSSSSVHSTITGDIPIGTRLLELAVTQQGSGGASASWIQPTVERASLWWLVEALLAAGALLILVSGALLLGLAAPAMLNFDLLARRLVPAALLAAAAVQEAEAAATLLLPSWSFVFRLLAHV